jgi:hypothetical protein
MADPIVSLYNRANPYFLGMDGQPTFRAVGTPSAPVQDTIGQANNAYVRGHIFPLVPPRSERLCSGCLFEATEFAARQLANAGWHVWRKTETAWLAVHPDVVR